MLLVIDAGNTNVKFGLYDDDSRRALWRIRTEADRTADEYAALLFPLFAQSGLSFRDVEGVALASVVPAASPNLRRLARRVFGRETLHVTGVTDIGLTNAYQPPTDVGADRLMDAVAAVEKYGAPCIVVDFGTATTFNAVAAPPAPGAAPVYLGGAICLGISVSLQALFARAAKIPSIEITKPERAIGSNTNAALQSGIVFGYVAQVAGIVARFREEMAAPDCPVIATGGHAAHIVAEGSAVITAVEDHLTLEGLRLVYQRHHRADSPPAPDNGGEGE